MMRFLWDSSRGTARRMGETYVLFRQPVPKRFHKQTEAEYNAEGRAKRRKQHRFERGWLPFAQR